MRVCKEWRPVATMLAVDVVLAATNTMIKKAIDEGLNRLVFITLRQLVATLFMAPVAYFHERYGEHTHTHSPCSGNPNRAALTQYLFYFGMQYTSATFACAFLNIAPVFTFIISLAMRCISQPTVVSRARPVILIYGWCRIESLNLKTKAGIAKAMGTSLCLVGVVVLTFYRGIGFNGHVSHRSPADDVSYTPRKRVMGSVALLAGCCCWSAWFPLQSRVNKKYPALYSCTALIFFLAFLQAAALSLATQRGLSMWLLRRKLEIATVLFSVSKRHRRSLSLSLSHRCCMPLLGCRGIGVGLLGHVMVCGAKRTRLHRCIHAAGAGHCGRIPLVDWGAVVAVVATTTLLLRLITTVVPGPKMVDDDEHRDGQDLASLKEDQQLIKDDAPAVVEDVKEDEADAVKGENEGGDPHVTLAWLRFPCNLYGRVAFLSALVVTGLLICILPFFYVVTGEQGSGAAEDSTQSRNEKKSRQAMLKLGMMKPVTGVSRITIKRTNNDLFVISKPDVYKIQNTETYVVFGVADLKEVNSQPQSQTAQQLRMLDLSGATPKSHEPESETEDDEDVDDTGLEPRAIDMVMAQAGVSRAKAVVALRAYDGDVVGAIMDLTA
ncbi:hypothetical protein B296_00010973 [Ensete ventricosum]|uniref:NAC-A/B domain-containing protein n=1 Tax=Ensete ventricosum TaxID=4639 RepID=A0A427ACE9_ENSVE|nr:hypothetical protein B296_00010973 [Ensete ventricosum]